MQIFTSFDLRKRNKVLACD